MILYFSGTGNSQYVAVKIAEIIGDGQVFSINRAIKSGEKTVIRSEGPLVFVAPTYSWRLPRVVERWILETDFRGNRDAWFILTCGGIRKYFRSRHHQRIKALRLHPQIVLRVGLDVPRFQTQLQRRRREGHLLRLAGTVGHNLLHRRLGIPLVADGNPCVLNGKIILNIDDIYLKQAPVA